MANNHAAKKAEKHSSRPKARPQKARAPKVNRSGGGPGPLRRLFTSIWTWRLILLAAFIALFAWQWDRISEFINNLITGTYGALGWGLILILMALIVAVSVLFREQLVPFAKRWTLNYWYRWAGALILLFAIWGILGFFDLGGSVGSNIAGDDVVLGVFKILGLVLLAFILLLPAISWRVFKNIVGGLVGLFRMPAPKPRPTGMPASGTKGVASLTESERLSATESIARVPLKDGVTPPQRRIGLPSFGGSAEKAVKEPPKKPELETSTAAPRQPAQQVALDVWRKYGESSRVVVIDGWKLPPIDILDKAQEIEFSESDNRQRAKVIEDALASYGVIGKVIEINVGPTVTQFGVEPGWDIKTRRVQEKDKDGNVTARDEEASRTRVKVERITALSNNLALALSAPTIRIEAPVPGKPIVGIEVPNKVYSTVSLRGIIETNSFQKLLTKTKLAMALGKGAGGEAVADDLAKMPHILIAGATGSGKTVCLNAIICCILMGNTPYDTKLIMIDPKRVELTPFNSLPHLAAPVIVDTDKALSTMRWLNMEMDNRYKKLAATGSRNIDGYNKGKTGPEKMPYLILVIDELADLMMAGFDEVEHILCRLAQLARAVGIHLVVATQRPSVDVITGLIKANFPTRISFAVTSQVDSRTILDMVGAEKLLGRGDMLYAPTEAAKPKRLQGCYVSDAEVERLVYFWNSQKKQDVAPLNVTEIASAPPVMKKESQPVDPLMDTVRQLAGEHDQISASYLQRKLGIGYPRAARLYDKLKEEMESGLDGGAEMPKDGPEI
ncbi:MAG: DNA translocase FtsK [Dehalococcoidia bacterium]|nr:MAG: DNA translocase FtsK [Dehalococcoidia bacterium]